MPEDKNNVPFYVKHGFSVMENGVASKADCECSLYIVEICGIVWMCSDSEKNMSAFADQNHAPSLTCVRLEFTV